MGETEHLASCTYGGSGLAGDYCTCNIRQRRAEQTRAVALYRRDLAQAKERFAEEEREHGKTRLEWRRVEKELAQAKGRIRELEGAQEEHNEEVTFLQKARDTAQERVRDLEELINDGLEGGSTGMHGPRCNCLWHKACREALSPPAASEPKTVSIGRFKITPVHPDDPRLKPSEPGGGKCWCPRETQSTDQDDPNLCGNCGQWVQCTSVDNRCLGGCANRAEHERYNATPAAEKQGEGNSFDRWVARNPRAAEEIKRDLEKP